MAQEILSSVDRYIMNELELQNLVRELLEERGLEVRTFEEDMVLTNNKGLVVTNEDGSTLHLEVKS